MRGNATARSRFKPPALMARQRPRPVQRASPHRSFLLVAGIATVGLTLAARRAAGWDWPWAYLASTNLVTFALYAIDKRRSSAGGMRVPETILHLTAGAGGTPGAFAGQQLLRHKTAKASFQLRFWLIVAVQVLALMGWWYTHSTG